MRVKALETALTNRGYVNLQWMEFTTWEVCTVLAPSQLMRITSAPSSIVRPVLKVNCSSSVGPLAFSPSVDTGQLLQPVYIGCHARSEIA